MLDVDPSEKKVRERREKRKAARVSEKEEVTEMRLRSDHEGRVRGAPEETC